MKGRAAAQGTLIYSRESPPRGHAGKRHGTGARKDLCRLLTHPSGRQWGERRKVTFTFRSCNMGQVAWCPSTRHRGGRRAFTSPRPLPRPSSRGLLWVAFPLNLTPFTQAHSSQLSAFFLGSYLGLASSSKLGNTFCAGRGGKWVPLHFLPSSELA